MNHIFCELKMKTSFVLACLACLTSQAEAEINITLLTDAAKEFFLAEWKKRTGQHPEADPRRNGNESFPEEYGGIRINRPESPEHPEPEKLSPGAPGEPNISKNRPRAPRGSPKS